MRVGFVPKETGHQIGRKLVYSEVNFMLLKIVKDVMNFCLLYWKLKPRQFKKLLIYEFKYYNNKTITFIINNTFNEK